MKLFASCLVTRSIERVDPNATSNLVDLAKLWELADRLLLPSLQDEAMTLITEADFIYDRPTFEVLFSCIFDGEARTILLAPFAQYAVDTVLWWITKNHRIKLENFDELFDEHVSSLPAAMQILILRELARFSFLFTSQHEFEAKETSHYFVKREAE
jgi:hypothetical protein